MSAAGARAAEVATGPALVCADVDVVGAEPLGAGFVRVTLAGGDLEYASEELRVPGPVADAYVKLFVPPRGRCVTELAYPDPDDLRGWFARPSAERGWMRTYTVRLVRHVELGDDVVPALDVDVLVHPGSDEGPGSRWAREARPGDRVRVLVPGRGHPVWSGYAPGEARTMVCAGDASAAPALSSIAELVRHRGGVEADVLVEVDDPRDRDALLADAADPGAGSGGPDVFLGSGTPGAEAVRRLAERLGVGAGAVSDVLSGRRPSERQWETASDIDAAAPYVMLAGEATMVKAMRRICVDAAGIPKGNVAFMGYWKAGAPESD